MKTMADEIAFMKNDLGWPLLWLPLKRRPNENPNCGVLVDPKPWVYLVNLYATQNINEAEILKYQDWEALYDAGWRVD